MADAVRRAAGQALAADAGAGPVHDDAAGGEQQVPVTLRSFLKSRVGYRVKF